MVDTSKIRELLKDSKESLERINYLEKLAMYGEVIEAYFYNYTFMKAQVETNKGEECSYEDIDISGMDELISFMNMDLPILKLTDLKLEPGRKYKDNICNLEWEVIHSKEDGAKRLVLCSNEKIRIEGTLTIEELILARFIIIC